MYLEERMLILLGGCGEREGKRAGEVENDRV